MNLKKFFMILLCLAVVLPLMVAQPKDIESISIVAEVPVSEKGYSLDPASPYLPPVSGLANTSPIMQGWMERSSMMEP